MLQSINNKTVANTVNLINDSIREIRQLSRSLAPKSLNELGLCAVIGDEVKRLDELKKISFRFYENINEARFDELIEINIYRIFQECVSNIFKHSGAKNVHIQLVLSKGILSLSVEDDGKGFLLDEVNQESLGLASMKNRANLIRGNIEIDSKPDAGTNILVEVKL